MKKHKTLQEVIIEENVIADLSEIIGGRCKTKNGYSFVVIYNDGTYVTFLYKPSMHSLIKKIVTVRG